MPHALSDLQREYLEFIRQYIETNESSPRLDEIATHFGVKAPTAHKMLEALHNKGFLYFARDKFSGFFIRLIERAGSAETVIEVPMVGKVNKLGRSTIFLKSRVILQPYTFRQIPERFLRWSLRKRFLR